MKKEFAINKLGEVLGFTLSGMEVLEKSNGLLKEILGDEAIDELTEVYRIEQNTLEDVAEKNETKDRVLEKARTLSDKIASMRETYIEEWENKEEVLEWLSFFHGAAAARWALLRGVAEGAGDEVLIAFAEESQNVHIGFLDRVETELESLGQDSEEELPPEAEE